MPATSTADVPIAPRGGRAALQVAFVVSGTPTIRAESLRLRDASGASLPPATVTLLRDIHVTRTSDAVRAGMTGSVPDPLVPLPAEAGSQRVQSLYVEVAVPRTAQPGRYTGDLAVEAGTARGSTEVTVDVASVELPDEHALRTWFLVWDDRAESMERAPVRSKYHALLHAEGIGDGTATSADRAIGIEVPAPHAADAATARQRADALLQRRPDAIPYSYEFDEPSDDAEHAAVAAWGRDLQQQAPDVRQLVTAPPWDGLAPGDVGVFAVHLKDAATALPQAHALGADLWIYSSCCERSGDPTMLMDDAASSNAAVAPATWLVGGRGVLYWGVSAYMANPWRVASTDPTGVANGDGVLIYPGRPAGLSGPVPSLRLKLFALGMQLVDLATVAEARGAGEEAHAVLTTLVNGRSAADDGAAWDAAERRLVALAGG